MPTDPVNVLLIEDEAAQARLIQEFLAEDKIYVFRLVNLSRLELGLQRLTEEDFDVVLLDLTLPDSVGLDSLDRLMQQERVPPIVVLTNTNDDELALEAVRRGAQDYLLKRQITGKTIMRSLRYAIARKQILETLRTANTDLQEQVDVNSTKLSQMQDYSQWQSDFVSMLTHDCRSPLTTILLSSGMLQTNYADLSGERRSHLFELIRSASHNMAQLLDEAMLVGQAKAGKLEFSPKLLDLEEFCAQLLEELQLCASEKEIELCYRFEGTPMASSWDENLLHHILRNLLGNAIKYSFPRGSVWLELHEQPQNAKFYIRDRGIGIPKAEQPYLFEPFIRASNVGEIPGTGLGLAIVKRCVEVHGGEISFESISGEGTTFIVTLPRYFESEG